MSAALINCANSKVHRFIYVTELYIIKVVKVNKKLNAMKMTKLPFHVLQVKRGCDGRILITLKC